MPMPQTPAKPCDKCNGHLGVHGSIANVLDYIPIPGMPMPEITSAHDHINHKHGQRKCDECDTDFHGHFSFGDDHPDSPALPFPVAPGKMALVHKKCLILHQSKLEAESQAKTE